MTNVSILRKQDHMRKSKQRRSQSSDENKSANLRKFAGTKIETKTNEHSNIRRGGDF
jgi:hypothetical protein